MTNNLVVIINSLKVPKNKKILLYEMKFLVPNYSCLQNPWLGGLPPPGPRSLCPQLNLLNPPPRTKFLGTPLVIYIIYINDARSNKYQTLNTAARNITTYVRRTTCQQFPCLTVYEHEADSKLIQLKVHEYETSLRFHLATSQASTSRTIKSPRNVKHSWASAALIMRLVRRR